jgi:uncharacterized protein (TIGR02598 family)
MNPQSGKASRGFTLVEVVLCLGVVGFAFVGLLGLLPVGLKTFRTAMDTSAQSQIAQRVATDIQQARFSDLNSSSYASDHFPQYFDDQGMVVSNADDPNRIYTVSLASPASATSLPGVSGTGSSLLIFKLSIAARDATRGANVFSVVVADKGL